MKNLKYFLSFLIVVDFIVISIFTGNYLKANDSPTGSPEDPTLCICEEGAFIPDSPETFEEGNVVGPHCALAQVIYFCVTFDENGNPLFQMKYGDKCRYTTEPYTCNCDKEDKCEDSQQ